MVAEDVNLTGKKNKAVVAEDVSLTGKKNKTQNPDNEDWTQVVVAYYILCCQTGVLVLVLQSRLHFSFFDSKKGWSCDNGAPFNGGCVLVTV